MSAEWSPGTQYNLGDVVQYGGHRYKIIQPHFSQGDWTPDRTPALWGRLPDETPGYQPGYQPAYGEPQQPIQQDRPTLGEPQQSGANWDEHKHQKVDIPHEEQKKNWWDLDEKRKKELEIGGGLALGAALLGGGLFAYKHHQKSEEEKKAVAWGLQQWLRDAQVRTENFHRNGPSTPVTWLLVHGKNVPNDLIQGGEERGDPLFICRSFYNGSIQVGMASQHTKQGGIIGYGHNEIDLDTYEILTGDIRSVRWVDFRGKLDLGALGGRPVEAGREGDGTPLYIAQAHVNNAIRPGKVSERLDGAFIPIDGTEKKIKDYRVLCYAF